MTAYADAIAKAPMTLDWRGQDGAPRGLTLLADLIFSRTHRHALRTGLIARYDIDRRLRFQIRNIRITPR